VGEKGVGLGLADKNLRLDLKPEGAPGNARARFCLDFEEIVFRFERCER
jgi:hypothetical protein